MDRIFRKKDRGAEGDEDAASQQEGISVAIRIRPPMPQEMTAGDKIVWRKISNPVQQFDALAQNPGEGVQGFEKTVYQFRKIFTEIDESRDIYSYYITKIVKDACKGVNGSVFAYGQTGSGKTFTMIGNNKNPGVIPLSVREVFQVIESNFVIKVSYMEIYNEVITDLLNRDNTNLKIYEHKKRGVYVRDLSEREVMSPEDVFAVLKQGNKARHTEATVQNQRSSRSHAIFKMSIESRDADAAKLKAVAVKTAQLNLVDLAGSERTGASDNTKERKKEGNYINKSLLTLSTVIGLLSKGKSKHVPYRDSKITRILQPALGGNSQTCIVCTVTLVGKHALETHSTLQFATKAKNVKNTVKANTILDDSALLKQYTNEIELLRRKIRDMEHRMVAQNAVKAFINIRERLKTRSGGSGGEQNRVLRAMRAAPGAAIRPIVRSRSWSGSMADPIVTGLHEPVIGGYGRRVVDESESIEFTFDAKALPAGVAKSAHSVKDLPKRKFEAKGAYKRFPALRYKMIASLEDDDSIEGIEHSDIAPAARHRSNAVLANMAPRVGKHADEIAPGKAADIDSSDEEAKEPATAAKEKKASKAPKAKAKKKKGTLRLFKRGGRLVKRDAQKPTKRGEDGDDSGADDDDDDGGSSSAPPAGGGGMPPGFGMKPAERKRAFGEPPPKKDRSNASRSAKRVTGMRKLKKKTDGELKSRAADAADRGKKLLENSEYAKQYEKMLNKMGEDADPSKMGNSKKMGDGLALAQEKEHRVITSHRDDDEDDDAGANAAEQDEAAVFGRQRGRESPPAKEPQRRRARLHMDSDEEGEGSSSRRRSRSPPARGTRRRKKSLELDLEAERIRRELEEKVQKKDQSRYLDELRGGSKKSYTMDELSAAEDRLRQLDAQLGGSLGGNMPNDPFSALLQGMLQGFSMDYSPNAPAAGIPFASPRPQPRSARGRRRGRLHLEEEDSYGSSDDSYDRRPSRRSRGRRRRRRDYYSSDSSSDDGYYSDGGRSSRSGRSRSRARRSVSPESRRGRRSLSVPSRRRDRRD